MKDIDEELRKLESTLGAVVAQMEPAARSALARKMAHALRASQAARMRAQAGPDGEPWPARKNQARDRKANRPIRFLYRKPGADEPRVADLRSWRRDGAQIIGYDRERGAIRTFLRGRIVRHLPAEGAADPGKMEADLRGRGGQIRKRVEAMFVKMRTNRHLKAGGSPTEAWVEFTSRAERIARVSQFGLKDKVRPGGPEVRYPQRQLLGFSAEDREAMIQLTLDHLDDGR
ncbi:phage virion morphogenesis protein [Caulobacter segnis]|uniref:Phage virion morphogenesis protein n=1 Tax=Caulobacter segnis TaxID=88688 RepID=A0A2W5VPD2_9CAUL|nr:phage virion morphogenesis protein [Caulobacter segnis]PZR37175.1 MAG: hypothetical protein DI526_01275 [Caulobacter segnis]